MTSGMGDNGLTDWASSLGLSTPIVCAPMGGVAGGRLAAAVSRAGGLGMIGMGSAGSVTALERELAALGEGVGAGGAPFGIGLVAWGIAQDPELFERALAARPSLVSVSFGEWGDPQADVSWIERVHACGAVAVTQAATADEARRAAAAGVDAIVARGSEGGGHGDHQRPRDALLAEIVSAVDTPVLAAGAISTSRDVARVLEAGAAAAWVGTAFAACEEALTATEAREVLLRGVASDTLVTRVYDVALGRPWPKRVPERLLRTPFIDQWHGREDELETDAEARAAFVSAAEAGDYSIVPVDAGEGVGHLTRVQPAAEVVASLR